MSPGRPPWFFRKGEIMDSKNPTNDLALHVISMMSDDDKESFLEDPEAWREGLSVNFVVNLSTGEQEVDEDDLIEAITGLLLVEEA
jgi:hypothetical protein